MLLHDGASKMINSKEHVHVDCTYTYKEYIYMHIMHMHIHAQVFVHGQVARRLKNVLILHQKFM